MRQGLLIFAGQANHLCPAVRANRVICATSPPGRSGSGPSRSLHQSKFHFAFVAGDFDGEALGLDIYDFGAEDVGDLHHLRAVLGIDRLL